MELVQVKSSTADGQQVNILVSTSVLLVATRRFLAFSFGKQELYASCGRSVKICNWQVGSLK